MNSSDFSGYIESYGKDVYSFCIYLTRNKDDADDLYQQTFLTAIEKNEINENDNPRSYLITIAANTWKNRVRKELWRKKKVDIVYFGDENCPDPDDGRGSAEDISMHNSAVAALRKCVIKLPDKLRPVILMYYMEDMSVSEIAKALKIPEGTVKSRMNHAKKYLKEWMKDYEG